MSLLLYRRVLWKPSLSENIDFCVASLPAPLKFFFYNQEATFSMYSGLYLDIA